MTTERTKHNHPTETETPKKVCAIRAGFTIRSPGTVKGTKLNKCMLEITYSQEINKEAKREICMRRLTIH